MVPAVTKKGHSFKAAALYYLHDKGALTDERVAFTHTVNLATDDAHMAARMMAYTAMHQSDIKLAAGGEAKGRKLSLPVYAYSLAWHPTEAPTKAEMIEAAHETLKALDLTDHEVIMAAHNDEKHPHLHLIVNRVHPETGIAAKLSNDRLRLSEWAEKYERDRGQIFCDRRVENNERRKDQYVKDRESQHAAEFHKWRSEQSRQRVERRQQQLKNLSDHHKRQQQILENEKRQQIAKSRAALRVQNHPEWAALNKRQLRQREDFAKNQTTAWGRVLFYLKNRDPWDGSGSKTPLRGVIAGAFQAIASDTQAAATLKQKQQRERKNMAERVTRQVRAAVKRANADHSRKLDPLIAQQRADRAATAKAQILASQQSARDLVSGKARADFDRLNQRYKPLRDSLREAVTNTQPEHPAAQDAKRATSLADDFAKSAEDTPRDTKAEQAKQAREAKRRDLKKQMEQTKDEITRDVKADQKKADEDEKRKGTYTAFRDLADETTREKAHSKHQDRDDDKKKTSYRAFTDHRDGKGRDTDKGRDKDQGRERGPRKPPKPPDSGR